MMRCWGRARPSRSIPPPLCSNYAQEIFEGLKAYKLPDGSVASFRPEANAARFNESATRLAMPHLPEDLFVESIRQLVGKDVGWVPDADKGSLYLRPFMFASEAFLGVRPAKEYIYCVIASPVGGYFKGGKSAVTLWVSHDQVRAVPGGTGAAKCGGNYAASLMPQAVGIAHGCDQVLFLDAVERRWIEELGGMNIFFVFNDGSMTTPRSTALSCPASPAIRCAPSPPRRATACARSPTALSSGWRTPSPAASRKRSPAAPRR